MTRLQNQSINPPEKNSLHTICPLRQCPHASLFRCSVRPAKRRAIANNLRLNLNGFRRRPQPSPFASWGRHGQGCGTYEASPCCCLSAQLLGDPSMDFRCWWTARFRASVVSDSGGGERKGGRCGEETEATERGRWRLQTDRFVLFFLVAGWIWRLVCSRHIGLRVLSRIKRVAWWSCTQIRASTCQNKAGRNKTMLGRVRLRR
jgi:hypothetical protein